MALVRVRKDSMEFDVGASHAAANGLEVIATGVRPSPPTRSGGRPRKPRTTVDEAAGKRTTTRSGGRSGTPDLTDMEAS